MSLLVETGSRDPRAARIFLEIKRVFRAARARLATDAGDPKKKKEGEEKEIELELLRVGVEDPFYTGILY